MKNPDMSSPFLRSLVAVGVRASVAHAIACTYFGTVKNARQRGIECSLTEQDVGILTARCHGACEISGIPFAAGGAEKRHDRQPWAPSFDRIDRAKGYSIDNCRLVCVAANLAMNTWGESVLRTLAMAIISPRSKAA